MAMYVNNAFSIENGNFHWNNIDKAPYLETSSHSYRLYFINTDNIDAVYNGEFQIDLMVYLNNEDYDKARKEAEIDDVLDDFDLYTSEMHLELTVSVANGKVTPCDSGYCGNYDETKDADLYLLTGTSEAMYFESVSIKEDLPQLNEFVKQVLNELSHSKIISDDLKKDIDKVLTEDKDYDEKDI